MKNYIHQIQIKQKKQSFRKPTGLRTKLALETELKNRELKIKLLKRLKGGVDSQVYSAKLKGQNVVVKHTEDRGSSVFNPPFTPVDFFVPRENHNLDSYILKKLAKTSIRVPKLIHHFPNINTTVMEDLRTAGFDLMSDLILSGNLSTNSAKKVAHQLLKLAKISNKWKKFKCYKTPEAQIFERGLELRMLYPNSQTDYLEIRRNFLDKQKHWMWPDGHPKNMFVDKNSNIAFIDFGGSYWGDQRFMLPNFIGQFLVLALYSKLSKSFCLEYVEEMINEHKKAKEINESLFCKYVGMETLHRAFGKWIDIELTAAQKARNLKLGLSIFDKKIVTIDNLINFLNQEI